MERAEASSIRTHDSSTKPGHSLSALLRRFQRTDIQLTDRYLGRTLFHHGYWYRKRIDAAVAAAAGLAKADLLDVGCGVKPYEKAFAPYVDRYIGLEYLPESGYRGNRADICGDALCLPLVDGSFDTVLCTEMIVNLPDPYQAIAEFARVLRDDGIMIVTAPFVYPMHDAADYLRFAPLGVATIMERSGITVEKVVPLSGTAIAIGGLFNLYWYDALFMWTKWLYPIGVLLRPVLWLIVLTVNLLARACETIFPDERLSFGHLTVGRKVSGV